MTGSSAAAPAGWLQPAGPDERGGLRSYLHRLVGLDDRAAVRLQGTGTVVGVWGGPPLGVLTLRPVGLAHPTVPGLDLTLSAQRLLERVDSAGPDGPVALPPPVPGPAWAGLLPPRGGWDEVAVVPSASVHDAVRVGVEAFRRRVDLLPVDGRQRPALEAVAEQVWNQPLLAGIPLRAAHAAQLSGLLSLDGQVRAYSCGPWLRLSCPGGSVALRRDGGTGLGLDLGVWALLADSVGDPAARTV